MGFGDIVLAINRSTRPLDYVYDGRHAVLPPGYRVDTTDPKKPKFVPAGKFGQPVTTPLLFQVAEMARRQNIIKGTENPYDPADVEYLVGIAVEDEEGTLRAMPTWPHNRLDHCEQSAALERLDRRQMVAEAQQAIPRQHPMPGSRAGAGGNEPFKAGNESLTGLDMRG